MIYIPKNRFPIALACLLALICDPAPTADIALEPPPGGAVIVKDGDTPRMRIDRAGAVQIPGLDSAATEETPVCFDTSTGQLGNCPGARPRVAGDGIILVNSLADDAAPTDGQCTLREAINNANNDTDTAPTVEGECGTGDNSGGVTRIDLRFITGTITLKATLPDVDADVVIQGPAQDMLSIDGAGSHRVL